MIEGRITYFESSGAENTDAVLEIVGKRAKELDVKKIVIASRTGDTAVTDVMTFEGFKLVVVSHSTGFDSPDVQKFSVDNRKIVESKGGVILTMTHVFAGIHRAMRTKFNTHVTGDVMSNTLRIFGQGMKVACEIAMMAADGGLVRTDEDIISIGGTRYGADTAILLKPLNSHQFFDLRIREILCKPRF
ncbi:MAG: hypothetical protein JRJ31_05500 [Deltaproteobacteria bacterium]|nr:hypothetical protein [Deltaproteobacteria bacterium]